VKTGYLDFDKKTSKKSLTELPMKALRIRYWKEETEERSWKVIPDTQEALTTVLRKGCMFISTPALSTPYDAQNPDAEIMRFDNLVLDFDDKANPGNAHRELLVLTGHIAEQYGIDPYCMSFWCSGSKGFHCSIPAECFGSQDGDPYLPLIYKRIVCQWAASLELSTIDTSMYCMSRGKMFRIENVKRSNGRYKVPLTLDEVQSLPIETLWKLSENPREVEPVDADTECEDLAKLYQECKSEVRKEIAAQKNQPPVDPEIISRLKGQVAPCIVHILRDNPKTDTSFNTITMNLCKYFRDTESSLNNTLHVVESFLQSYPYSTSYTSYNERLKHFKEQWAYHQGRTDNPFRCSYILGMKLKGSAFDCKKCQMKEPGENSDADATPPESDKWIGAIELFPQLPEFPFKVLPEDIAASLKQLAVSCATSSNSLAGAAITIICAMLGKTISVSPKASWTSPIMLWVGDIKSSGQGKSPPVKLLLKPVWSLQRSEDDRVEKINDIEMDKKPKDRRLTRGRSFLLTDMTLEALRGESKACPTGGILYHTDELSAMINGQNQYKSGKGNDRESFLNIHSGTGSRVGRVSESVSVDIDLNIIGGIQPFVFQKVFGAENGFYLADGTVTRFLWTFEPEANHLLTEEVWSIANAGIWSDLINRSNEWSLAHIEKRLKLIFTTDAFTKFCLWRNSIYKKIKSFPPEVRAFIPKTVDYAVRLSAAIHCISCLNAEMDISPILQVEDIQKGIDAASYYMGNAIAAIRHIREGFIPVNVDKAQMERLLITLESLKNDTESGRLAVGYICKKYNEGLPVDETLSPRAIGSLIRKCGLEISASKFRCNGIIGAYCLVWDDKKFLNLKNEVHKSTSPQT
jgi:Protein of unknown function (DUF3987)